MTGRTASAMHEGALKVAKMKEGTLDDKKSNKERCSACGFILNYICAKKERKPKCCHIWSKTLILWIIIIVKSSYTLLKLLIGVILLNVLLSRRGRTNVV